MPIWQKKLKLTKKSRNRQKKAYVLAKKFFPIFLIFFVLFWFYWKLNIFLINYQNIYTQ